MIAHQVLIVRWWRARARYARACQATDAMGRREDEDVELAASLVFMASAMDLTRGLDEALARAGWRALDDVEHEEMDEG